MFPLWNFFLERKAFTILVMASLVIAGVTAIFALPKESTPEVVIPIGIVTTVLPGATPADIERLVTDKLEPAITNVPNIDKVTSSSRQGVSTITAQFVASADIETALQDLRSAIDQVEGELPSDAESPRVMKVDFQDQPIMMIAISSDLAPETLHSLSTDLERELITLEGVSNVEVTGVRSREVSIVVNPSALARHSISVNNIVSALQSSNTSVPAGSLIIDGVQYPIQFNGSLDNIEDIFNIPVRTSSGEVRIRDVADIIDGFEKTSTISRLYQKEGELSYALTLNVYKSGTGNILTVSDKVKEKLESLQDSLLLGSEYVIVYDTGNDIRTSIGELTSAGRDTVLLVILVLFIAVGFREALVSAVSIPLSFTIAFLGMWVTGNSINFISLFALVIAIGILVDSGIVVVEAIHTNRESGMDKMAAAKLAIKQYAWPLIAGTMTTVAVFVPLFFLSGIMGQFLLSIPFTIIVVLLASIVVALGFIPIIATWSLKHSDGFLSKKREEFWIKVTSWYKGKLRILFRSRFFQRVFFGLLALSFVVAVALPATGLLKSILFPPSDLDLFFIEIELPQASILESTDKVTREVEKVIEQKPEVASYLTTVGAGSAFNYSSGSGSKVANITVNLDKDRPADRTSIDIAAELREELSHLEGMDGAKIVVSEASEGPPAGAPITVKVWSDDTAALTNAITQVENIVSETEGTRDISSSLSNDTTELVINIDRNKASEYGLTSADVAFALRAAISGVEAIKLRVDGDDVAVRVITALNTEYVQPEDVTITDSDAIAEIPVQTSRGTIPLGSLITIEAGRSSASIEHEDAMRIGTVSAQVEDGANPIEITNQIRSAIEELDVPEGVRFTYGGDDEEIRRTFTEMIFALVAGLILMFSMLILIFNTFRASLRVLLTIPLSLTGVLIGLFLMGQPLSLTAFLGIIALAGVIINHGILLIDRLNHIEVDEPELTPEDMVLTAATSRLRPILLTTTTTIIGMIPLTLVSDMWAPLAYTIAFGLIYGTVLTLILIPVLSFRHLSKKKSRA